MEACIHLVSGGDIFHCSQQPSSYWFPPWWNHQYFCRFSSIWTKQTFLSLYQIGKTTLNHWKMLWTFRSSKRSCFAIRGRSLDLDATCLSAPIVVSGPCVCALQQKMVWGTVPAPNHCRRFLLPCHTSAPRFKGGKHAGAFEACWYEG